MLYNPKYKYLKNKQGKCENCGFIAVDKCQLDLIRINENVTKTLCANCNRLRKKQSKQKSVLDITVDADVTIG
jgi:hypothetical protein